MRSRVTTYVLAALLSLSAVTLAGLLTPRLAGPTSPDQPGSCSITDFRLAASLPRSQILELRLERRPGPSCSLGPWVNLTAARPVATARMRQGMFIPGAPLDPPRSVTASARSSFYLVVGLGPSSSSSCRAMSRLTLSLPEHPSTHRTLHLSDRYRLCGTLLSEAPLSRHPLPASG